MNRRTFFITIGSKTLAAGVGAAAVPALLAAPERKLKIGYTCITWGTFPRGPEASATLEAAVKDISSLGFYAFETFPEVLEDWDSRGALSKLIDQYQLPLRSGYCGTNLTDPSKRKESVEKTIRLGKMIKKYGGTFGVIAPNSVKRDGYSFKEHRTNIIAGLNDHAMALTDLGLGTGLHQHTGTCVESREEVYAVLESVDTKYVKFGPDVGQLAKGGVDPVKVVRDFLPIIRHVHLKDWNGGPHWAQYCPLGEGKVDVPGVLALLESAPEMKIIMVELDPSKDPPHTPRETALISKDYLRAQGYEFRAG